MSRRDVGTYRKTRALPPWPDLPVRGARRRRRGARRRRMRGAAAALAVGLIGLAARGGMPNASAQEAATPGFERRPYVGIGAGITRLEPDSPTRSLSVADESSAGVHAYAGYDLTRWLSAELYFADLGEAGIDFLGTDVGDVGYRVYGINAVAWLYNADGGFGPMADDGSALARRRGMSLFLTAGIGGLDNDSDLDYRRDHAAHASFGGGLEYGFGNGVALRAEVQSYDADAQYASLSVLKRFGGSSAAAPAAVARSRPPEPVAPVAPPAAAPEVVEVNEMFRPIVPPYLYFEFDSATLTAPSRTKLDAFVDEVRDTDFVLNLRGHTDSIGPERYNLELSRVRAAAVREYLLSTGLPADRLSIEGYGETRPISTNSTPQGRADNRRAEIVLGR